MADWETDYIIKDEIRLRNCIEYITKLHKSGVKFQVNIDEPDTNRSKAQNKLMWKWASIIGNHLGYKKEKVHADNKARYFQTYQLPVFVPKQFSWVLTGLFKDIASNIYKKGGNDEYVGYHVEVPKGSTADLTTKEMGKYLEDMEDYWATQEIVLPKPDTYRLAVFNER